MMLLALLIMLAIVALFAAESDWQAAVFFSSIACYMAYCIGSIAEMKRGNP